MRDLLAPCVCVCECLERKVFYLTIGHFSVLAEKWPNGGIKSGNISKI